MNPNDTKVSRPVGPIIGLVIIIAIIFLGGIYFWMTRSNSNYSNENSTTGNNETSAIENNVPNNSDDTAAIEKSLNETNIEAEVIQIQ